MSRFGYDGEGELPYELWQRAVANAMGGKKGQKLLLDLAAALEAMPEHRLVANYLANEGDVCSVGAHAIWTRLKAQGVTTPTAQQWRAEVDTFEYQLCDGKPRRQWHAEIVERVGYFPDEDDRSTTIDVAVDEVGYQRCLAWELGDQNDNGLAHYTPEERWAWVHAWARAETRTGPRQPLLRLQAAVHQRLASLPDDTHVRFWAGYNNDRALARMYAAAAYTLDVQEIALQGGVA